MSNINRRNFVKAAIAGTAAATAVTPAIVLAEDDKEKAVRLHMQTYSILESDLKKFGVNVAVASENSIIIKHHSSNSRVPDAEMFHALSKGTLDMCQGYADYWADELDIASLETGVAGAWITSDEADYIHREGLIDTLREAYAEHNIHYLAPILGGSYDLLTKKSVKSLNDLRKLKLSAAPSVAKILAKFEIKSVYIPADELYDAFSTGVIDGAIQGGTIEYTDLKLYEVAKYCTVLNMLYPGFASNILINNDKWLSLSDSQRTIIEVATAQYVNSYHKMLVDAIYEEKYTKNFDIYRLPDDDVATLRETAKFLWLEEAKKSERNKKVVELLELVTLRR